MNWQEFLNKQAMIVNLNEIQRRTLLTMFPAPSIYLKINEGVKNLELNHVASLNSRLAIIYSKFALDCEELAISRRKLNVLSKYLNQKYIDINPPSINDLNSSLEKLINLAQPNNEWLDFHDEQSKTKQQNRSLVANYKDIYGDDEDEEIIELELKKPYTILTELPQPEGYFILLYKSADKLRIVCPSSKFAPNNNIVDSYIEIPNKIPNENGATATAKNVKFSHEGIDEFIGILINQEFHLEDLQTDEKIPLCTQNHLDLIFSKLDKSKEYQVFYQRCRIF